MRRDPASAPGFFRRLVAGLLLCLLALASFSPAIGQTEELLIGIEPEHNIFDQMERHRRLAAYLSAQLGVKVNLTIMSRYGEVIKRFKSLKLDGAFLAAYTATMGISALNLEPVVSPVGLAGESKSQGYIFVRKDSGIRNVRDMRGKSIVFVDPATMEGYLYPLVYLKRQGITDISTFFHRFSSAGSDASAIFSVLDGRADMGAAKDTIFNELAHREPSVREELHIIARSPRVPEITLCMRSEIDGELRARLTAVLLDMGKTQQGRKVLEQFKARSFVRAKVADFAGIEGLAQEARDIRATAETD